MQRKLLAARADLADRISEIAIRRGTLFDYVNDLLEQTLKIESLGLTLREIYDEMAIYKSAREVSFTLVPEALVMGLIKQVSGEGNSITEKLFYENGQWYGRYYGDFKKFETVMRKFLWGVSEFSIAKERGSTKLTCLSSTFSEKYCGFLATFFEGAMDSLGYKTTKKDVSKGIIKLSFNLKAE